MGPLCRMPVIALVLILGGLVHAASSPPEVWVDDDFNASTPGWGVTHFDKVQDGVDAVASGGVVHVESGVYAENVTVQKTVKLAGSGKSSTFIDGGGSGAVVSVMNGGDGSAVSGFTLRNTGVTFGSAGVRISHADDTVISENLFHGIYTGIQIDAGSGHALTSNKIENSIHNGIGVYTSTGPCHGNTVSGNTIQASGRAGVMIYGTGYSANNSFIVENTITDSFRSGIYISGENDFVSTGNTLSDNSISGSRTGEGVFLELVEDSGISGNVIRDNAKYAINCNKHVHGNTMADNDISGNGSSGIIVYDSTYNTISGNRLTANNTGITVMIDSHGTVVENNVLFDHKYTVMSIHGGDDNTVRDNIIQGCANGAGMGVYYQTDSCISNNFISDCNLTGITVYGPSDAITISKNVITDCDDGIGLGSSAKNTVVTKNILAVNRKFGLVTAPAVEGSIIYHNSFIDNAQANAFDAVASMWDDGYPSGGNYWSDYAGADLDGDGIGDTPHPVPGGSNQDRYPLMTPPGGGALWADTHVVSAASGGTVNFNIHAGSPNAGRHYLLLGGMSGTEPGTPLPGGMATLPVNWDVYTDLVMAYLNTPIFSDFLGVLDLQGTAAAAMQLPPLNPVAVGSRVYLAYTCNNPFDTTSNPVIIQVVD